MNRDALLSTRAERRGSMIVRILFILSLIAAGCSGQIVAGESELAPQVFEDGEPEPIVTAAVGPEPDSQPEPEREPEPAEPSTASALATADTDLPPAPVGVENLLSPSTGPVPVSMTIDTIDVSEATVIPVGVDEELAFEVPPADQVGWYKFGAIPGQSGSAVLAAHIAYDGVDGVFRYLEDVQVGAIVTIGFDDGSTARYRITEVTQYIKEALPDELFATEGPEQLALITCGGDFNDRLDSYDSNTVAIAVPI